MKQKLLLLFLAATFALKAQTKAKFSPAQVTGTWKCVAMQWDSAEKKITVKDKTESVYTFTAKNFFSHTYKCIGCSIEQVTTSGSWKLNTRGDSLMMSSVNVFQGKNIIATQKAKIISADSKKLALLVSGEGTDMILVLEKQVALTAASASKIVLAGDSTVTKTK